LPKQSCVIQGHCIGQAELHCIHTTVARHWKQYNLLYCLMDLVVDQCFVVLKVREDMLFRDEGDDLLDPIHYIRRQCLFTRKAVVPLWNVVRLLRHEEGAFMSREIQPYLKRPARSRLPGAGHAGKSKGEMGTSLLNVYLSPVSNHMSEKTKVLTISLSTWPC